MEAQGKVRLVRGLLGVIVLGAVLALPGALMASPSPGCGPGPGWVSACPGGTDKFESTSSHGVIIFDAGPTVNLPDLSGAMHVFRGAGSAGVIETEVISLTLTGGGFTLLAGDGNGNLLRDNRRFSPGEINELAPGSPIAHSFFDVFFEVDGPGNPFGPLHNEVFDTGGNRINECKMEADIDRVPPNPGTMYICTTLPVDLFDNAGNHRAILTGDVFHIVGRPIPEPSALLLLGSGLAGLSAAVWRRSRNR